MNIQIRSAVRGGAETAAVGVEAGGGWRRITKGLRCAARIETRLTGSVGHEKTYSSPATLMTNDTPDATVNPSRQFGLDSCKHTYKKKRGVKGGGSRKSNGANISSYESLGVHL